MNIFNVLSKISIFSIDENMTILEKILKPHSKGLFLL